MVLLMGVIGGGKDGVVDGVISGGKDGVVDGSYWWGKDGVIDGFFNGIVCMVMGLLMEI